MPDDLKYIHMRDKHDALGVAEKQWQQLATAPLVEKQFQTDHVYNVVFSGMGGSALAAFLATCWPGCSEPFEISRRYEIPHYVDSDTLFIASSYSGNTEETLAALEQAIERGAQIAVITSGGKLADVARQKQFALYMLPDSLQPRYATLYALTALLTLLGDAGLLEKDRLEDLSDAADFIKRVVQEWVPTVVQRDNTAKKLAPELAGTSPVIYSGPLLYPIAYKWKISINENAKNVAWCNYFPEFNHNEFLGWSSHPVQKPYKIIFLESVHESDRIKKRMDVTERLLSGRWPAPHRVRAKGDTLLEHMLYLMVLGDFTSIYMALINGIDPTPVDLIEAFKKQLANS